MCSWRLRIRKCRCDGVMECWSKGVMSFQTELRNKNRGYMNLIVWQKAMDLFELSWKVAFVEETVDFKLRSQFVNASQSVSTNISEGYCRRSIKEYLQFLYTAAGSLAEA